MSESFRNSWEGFGRFFAIERLFRSQQMLTLDGQNPQSPIDSVQRTRATLADHSGVPRGTNTAPTNPNLVIRITTQ